MKRSRVLITLVAPLVLIAACGHKAPPAWLEPEELPAPTGITALFKAGLVSISWDYPDKLRPYIKGFKVEKYRDGALVSSSGESGTSFQSTETDLSYRLAAIGKKRGAKALFSPLISTPSMDRLEPPSGLFAYVTAEGLRIKWDAVPGVEAYRVYRDTKGSVHGEESIGGFVGASSLMDASPHVAKGDMLLYRVSSVRRTSSDGVMIVSEGPASSPLEVDAQMFMPAAPTGVDIAQSEGKVLVYWDVNPEKWVEGYRVYRVDREGGLHHLADTITPAYTEKAPGHRGVGYAVSAFGKSLEGPASATVWVKAPASR